MEELRKAKRKGADDIAELLAGDLSVLKGACERVAAALEEIDMEKFEELADALEDLPATAGMAEAVRNAVADLNMLLIDVGEAEVFRAYVEAYDEAESKLFEFIDLRDADSYPGIADERAGAWEEAAEALTELAEQWDQVGIEEASLQSAEDDPADCHTPRLQSPTQTEYAARR